MQFITESQARRLASTYLEDPERKYIIYNIRERSYKLQSFYRYYFRFSRRESVWNTRLFSIDEIYFGNDDEDQVTDAIFRYVNERVEDVLELKLKESFTKSSCETMLGYYFISKCYLAYYDYYLGRVVLIKERDKSNDFGDLIGRRYYFIGDLHEIITEKIDFDSSDLNTFMSTLMNETIPIRNIAHFNDLNEAVHSYLVEEIDKIDNWVDYVYRNRKVEEK